MNLNCSFCYSASVSSYFLKIKTLKRSSLLKHRIQYYFCNLYIDFKLVVFPVTKIQSLLLWSIAAIALPTAFLTEAQAQLNKQLGDIEFGCSQSYDRDSEQYLFTTFAWNSQNKKPIIIWNNETFSDSGFDPQTRCEKVSPRFQEAYVNQTLNYLTHGTMNGQSVICTSSQAGGECQTLLLTLLPEDDPLQTLEQLSDVFLGYASSPLQQSSEDPVQEIGDRVYVEVDIEEFLAAPES